MFGQFIWAPGLWFRGCTDGSEFVLRLRSYMAVLLARVGQQL